MTRSQSRIGRLLSTFATLALALAAAGGPPGAQAAQAQPALQSDDGWRLLFDGETFDGWYTFLGSVGRNADPKGVFKIHDGMLHILDIPTTGRDEEFGYIGTVDEYADYHLRFQYRWGSKKFAPRADLKRDSGLLYHVVGPDLIWPRSVECQVQETDTGDLFLVNGTGATTTIRPGSNPPQFAEDGTPRTQIDGLVVKGGTYDSLDDWNTVEVIVSGTNAVHIVNGNVTHRISDIRQVDSADPSHTQPLSKGRILLQAEGAEIFYRNVEIRSLD